MQEKLNQNSIFHLPIPLHIKYQSKLNMMLTESNFYLRQWRLESRRC